MGVSRPKRTFDREFKLQRPRGTRRQLRNGEKRLAALCREHQLSETLVHRWKEQHGEHGGPVYPNLLPDCGWRRLTAPDQA